MMKRFFLILVCSFLVIIVGCSWNHDYKSSASAAYSNLRVNLPLPAGGAGSIRSEIRTSVAPENIKVWYYLSGSGASNQPIYANRIDGLDTNLANVLFEGVPNTADLVIKSQLSNDGQNFKDYYQGLVSKNEISGEQVSKVLNAETTAKTMIFEKKSENSSSSNALTVSELEATLANGEKNVWQYLGIGQDAFQNSLNSLTLDGEEIKTAVIEAANEIIVKPTPTTPTPTPTPIPTPTPTITDKGLSEELKALNFQRLDSLEAIRNLGTDLGIAEFSEGGVFVASKVSLRLIAEGRVENDVRNWTVYDESNKVRLISSVATTWVSELEQRGYHAVAYYSPSHSWFANELGSENFIAMNLKITNGIADLVYTTGESSDSSNWSSRSIAQLGVYATSTDEGSVYFRVENQNGDARIFDCASIDYN